MMAVRLIGICILAAAIAGCGGGGSTTTTTSDGGAAGQASAVGKTLFTDNCASCHILSDAGAAGTVGPNLDDLAPSADTVADQVRSGGGAMPSFSETLTDEQIEEVAAYVAAATGR
jgi:mono/diheme cytochrome c family protein